ncbi:MAG: vitamin K epoxide reductase family protein [Candidatus Aminicenantes bacterium]|nr:vitamin K epoxide reductase family protein [Candidatus Aminicenantes bacterium]
MPSQRKFSVAVVLSSCGLAVLLGYFFVRLYLHGGNERLCALILLLKVVGLLASFVLVLGTVDAPVFKRFCPRSPWFDCKRVIDSPAGMVLGLIHAADLGVLYFAGTLLVLLISAFRPGFYFQALYLGALNLFTLPYTLFSVAYQVFAVRRGCALCLIVQAVFWLEFWQFHPFVFGTKPASAFDLAALHPLLIGLALPAALWPLIRHLLEKAYRAQKDH